MVTQSYLSPDAEKVLEQKPETAVKLYNYKSNGYGCEVHVIVNRETRSFSGFCECEQIPQNEMPIGSTVKAKFVGVKNGTALFRRM